MDIKDVKTIYDIPRIEEYTNQYFWFNCMDIADKSIVYEYSTPTEEITLDIITDAKTIINPDKLHNILLGENIHYIQWTHHDLILDKKTIYAYRPHIEESKKNY